MKVLLVDDKQDIRNQLVDTWPSKGLKLTVAGDRTTANGYLSQDLFDAILIDLNLEDNLGEYSGIPFGAKVRERFPRMLMVMYSGYIEPGNVEEFSYYSECIQAGADRVIGRAWLTTNTPAQVLDTLQSWHEERLQKLRSHIDVKCADDLNLKAVLEQLGGPNAVKDILRTLFPTQQHFAVSALGGGYSGALLLQIKSAVDDATTPPLNNIVKISESDFALSDELKRRPFQGSQLERNAVVPRMKNPERIGKWFAFSVSDAGPSLTLEEYVLRQGVGKSVESRLSALVQDLLVDNARTATRAVNPQHKEMFNLKFKFLSELEEATTNALSFSKHLLPDDYSHSIGELRHYLDGARKGYYSIAGGEVYVATLHGDFHSRNILLPDPKGPPVVIDFGRTDVYPRLFDFAGLDVDLEIRVLDSGSGKEWDPKQVKKWWTHVIDVYPLGNRLPSTRSGGRVGLLRRLLHQALETKLEHVTKLEYAESLMFQLLRYIRFTNTPMPKRVLAACWAGQLTNLLGRQT